MHMYIGRKYGRREEQKISGHKKKWISYDIKPTIKKSLQQNVCFLQS